MRVRDIMTATVVTATSNTTFQDLVDLMLRHGVSGVPIVDAEHRPIGIVTEADLIAKEAYRSLRGRPADPTTGRQENAWGAKARGLRAGQLMTSPVRTACPQDLVRMAAARMVTTGVNRLPVVETDGRLVGIVSRDDVLRIFHRDDDDVAKEVERTLADPLTVPAGHAVRASVQHGVVTLNGSVGQASHAGLVEGAVRELPGVVDVISELTVAEGIGEPNRAKA
jgi:CBS domain-containing protein